MITPGATEPRALTAALQAPAFVPRGGGGAMLHANRHVERWAPETSASRMRPLRNLGFVDRLVAPWIESAQRSSTMRMFSHVAANGIAEREAAGVSWVFPRPWYQDELDWMAAARQVTTRTTTGHTPAPNLLTTRGTYVPPSQLGLPSVLHEYVAPSLSVMRAPSEAYSPLVPFAAHAMSHVVGPLGDAAAVRMSPGLRAVLSTMIGRSTASAESPLTRTSLNAPELVTPPAPRAGIELRQAASDEAVADRYAEQHAQVAELQRVARAAAERELADRQRQQAEALRRGAETAGPDSVQRRAALAQQLHVASREAAVRDARSVGPTTPAPAAVEVRDETRITGDLAAAMAALPAELASMVTAGIAARPEHAAAAIAELGEALRSVELLARNHAAGGTFEPTRGPRVVMPAGLGGLVSMVAHTQSTPMDAPRAIAPMRTPSLTMIERPSGSALGAATSSRPAALSHVAWSDRWLARFAGARAESLDVLSAAASPEARTLLVAGAAPDAVFVAPTFGAEPRATETRFSGTRTQDVLPTLRGGPRPEQPVLRFDDDAETPDDMLAAIAMSAGRARSAAASAGQPAAPSLPPVNPDRYQPRETLADVVAHAAPQAPRAGLSAQLASSPFAPALSHVLALGIAPTFDVRALFGAGLSSTYLAGMVSASTNETDEPVLRNAFEFSPTYVAGQPDEPAASQYTKVRSGLLSFEDEPQVAPSSRSSVARTMVSALSQPMLAESAYSDGTTSTSAPGMIAERAHAWSVAQQRSSSDLSFDFLPPELVLAARVYGLGPAEAAQAMRLAAAGPGQLSAMAGAVDRTFVQAMAIATERRGEQKRMVTAYPSGAPAAEAAVSPTSSAFGVERRAPRGAFLWPAASMAAIGLDAAGPDGDQSMSVAALELLAAQAVAELGTYSVLGMSAEARPADADGEPAPHVAARAEAFQQLFVALSPTVAGRASSPAAQAARAVALAGRSESPVSARDRALAAWDVLPVVYGAAHGETESLSTGEAASRNARRREELRALDPVFVEGLGSLSSRAGQALGSYVSAPAPASTSSSSREMGAVMRAPTAAPELVQTGRPAGRTGGGEVEIPAWFEQAARKMFESKSSMSDGISLAELTLVNAAPAPQIAAATRGSGGAPSSGSSPAAGPAPKQDLDIEQLANDVFREVLHLMDVARARNGEPNL